MRHPSVKRYYFILQGKSRQLRWKRRFDMFLSSMLIIVLSPVMLIIGALVSLDSPGGILFRQERVTQYGRRFKIYKFRTMVSGADRMGPAVTGARDRRVTRMGAFLRKTRLDELPQLFNVLAGDMTFVGTRPEVPSYVKRYTPEMWATLLLPAGVTSLASIRFKDEAKLLENEPDIDGAYVKKVLPQKMKWNLYYLRSFSLWKDWRIMLSTVVAVLK